MILINYISTFWKLIQPNEHVEDKIQMRNGLHHILNTIDNNSYHQLLPIN